MFGLRKVLASMVMAWLSLDNLRNAAPPVGGNPAAGLSSAYLAHEGQVPIQKSP